MSNQRIGIKVGQLRRMMTLAQERAEDDLKKAIAKKQDIAEMSAMVDLLISDLQRLEK